MTALSRLLNGCPLLPIIQTETPQQAVDIAAALAQGGVSAVEVVLRTPKALDAISAIRSALPSVLVGAGTVLNAAQAQDCKNAGAQFLVSPASTPALLQAMIDTGLPLAPGVSTVSEMAMAHEMGLNELKFFPANLSGGTPMLNAVRSILQQVRFCPTGGISAANLTEYLSLPNVFVVGGSWLTPADLVKAGDYTAITALTAESVRLANVCLAEKSAPLRKSA